MKKLSKINIKPGNLMKDDELMTLRGGYDACTCMCLNTTWYYLYGYLVSGTGDCYNDCRYAFGYEAGTGGNCVV